MITLNQFAAILPIGCSRCWHADPPPGSITDIFQPQAEIDLPLERPLYAPAIKPVLAEVDLQGDAGLALDDQDMAALYAQMVVDKAQLAHRIRHCLHRQNKISLAELCQQQALQHGLAELVTYLHMATDGSFKSSIDEDQIETIEWQVATADGASVTRQAHVPRVVFFQ